MDVGPFGVVVAIAAVVMILLGIRGGASRGRGDGAGSDGGTVWFSPGSEGGHPDDAGHDGGSSGSGSWGEGAGDSGGDGGGGDSGGGDGGGDD